MSSDFSAEALAHATRYIQVAFLSCARMREKRLRSNLDNLHHVHLVPLLEAAADPGVDQETLRISLGVFAYAAWLHGLSDPMSYFLPLYDRLNEGGVVSERELGPRNALVLIWPEIKETL